MLNKASILLLLSLAFLLPAPGRAQIPQDPGSLTIFFTGDVQGELKSCGCPKADLGGATRRAAFLDTLKAAGWEFLSVDAGGLTPPAPLDAKKKLMLQYLARAMGRMGFDAVALNDLDLAQGPDVVKQVLDWLGQPVVATNVAFPDGYAVLPAVTVPVRDWRVGVVAFLDPDQVTGDHDWLTVSDWESHRTEVQSLKEEVDLLVALASLADSTRFEALNRALPEIDIVVGTRRGDLPPRLLELESGYGIGSGAQGKHIGRMQVSFADDGSPSRVEAAFLPVVETWGRRPWIDEVVTEYNRAVRDLLLSGAGDASGR